MALGSRSDRRSHIPTRQKAFPLRQSPRVGLALPALAQKHNGAATGARDPVAARGSAVQAALASVLSRVVSVTSSECVTRSLESS